MWFSWDSRTDSVFFTPSFSAAIWSRSYFFPTPYLLTPNIIDPGLNIPHSSATFPVGSLDRICLVQNALIFDLVKSALFQGIGLEALGSLLYLYPLESLHPFPHL